MELSLTITLNLDNAEFDETPGWTAKRIIVNAISDMSTDWDALNEKGLKMFVADWIKDVNGNRVGKICLSTDEKEKK